MTAIVDDIGSFPLPSSVNRESFNAAYRKARDAMAQGKSYQEDESVRRNFVEPTINSFKVKLRTGLDVVNSPWHYNGIHQVSDAVHKAMEKGSFVVDERDAFFPEIKVIEARAKELSNEFGRKIPLRVSIFGPMEQYIKEIGTTPYADVLDAYAETIRRFAKNSLLDNKYVKTEVVSIDEPSFGYLNITADRDLLTSVIDKAFDFHGAVRQMHLHSSVGLFDLLALRNLNVVSFEFAAGPQNIEGVSRKMLEDADKLICVGVARTDIDAIIAELNDKGIAQPATEQLVEAQEVITKRYKRAKEKYGDRLAFTGPDCGLGSWPDQESAFLLLDRTVKAVKSAQI
jgi:5-methyltetrahydropteroyltriglutamate--homocysteine methyltransferase